jgi:hypothetical protein
MGQLFTSPSPPPTDQVLPRAFWAASKKQEEPSSQKPILLDNWKVVFAKKNKKTNQNTATIWYRSRDDEETWTKVYVIPHVKYIQHGANVDEYEEDGTRMGTWKPNAVLLATYEKAFYVLYDSADRDATAGLVRILHVLEDGARFIESEDPVNWRVLCSTKVYDMEGCRFWDEPLHIDEEKAVVTRNDLEEWTTAKTAVSTWTFTPMKLQNDIPDDSPLCMEMHGATRDTILPQAFWVAAAKQLQPSTQDPILLDNWKVVLVKQNKTKKITATIYYRPRNEDDPWKEVYTIQDDVQYIQYAAPMHDVKEERQPSAVLLATQKEFYVIYDSSYDGDGTDAGLAHIQHPLENGSRFVTDETPKNWRVLGKTEVCTMHEHIVWDKWAYIEEEMHEKMEQVTRRDVEAWQGPETRTWVQLYSSTFTEETMTDDGYTMFDEGPSCVSVRYSPQKAKSKRQSRKE